MTKLVDPGILSIPIWIDTSTKSRINGITELRSILEKLGTSGAWSIAFSPYGVVFCADKKIRRNTYARKCNSWETKDRWLKYFGWGSNAEPLEFPNVKSFLEVLKKKRVIKEGLCDSGRLG